MVCEHHVCPWRPEKGVGFSGAGVIEGCGPGNLVQIASALNGVSPTSSHGFKFCTLRCLLTLAHTDLEQ